ncbi:DUF2637 domain-containing protein [Pseudonocardia alni]|uniref:DUF2637 domain-containing protein n=1 Tax=Pseudonocardia alni TaxID=33907 RepID=UPI00332002AE
MTRARRGVVVTGLVILGAVGLILSFNALSAFAASTGTPSELAPLWAVLIDVLAIVGAIAWLGDGRDGLAKVLALTALGMSTFANITAHVVVLDGVAVVGGVLNALMPPLAIAGITHMLARPRTVADLVAERAIAPDPAVEPEPDDEPVPWETDPGEPESDPVEPLPTLSDRTASDDVLVADIVEWAARDDGVVPSRDKIRAVLGIGAGRAQRLRVRAVSMIESRYDPTVADEAPGR